MRTNADGFEGEDFVLRRADRSAGGCCHRTSIDAAALIESRRNAAEKSHIALDEIERAELLARLPAHLLEDQVARFVFELGDAKENKADGVLAGVGVLVARDLFGG